MANYDSALFEQKLKQLAKFRTVTMDDMEVAFWHACQDVEHNILTLRPERYDEARAWVRDKILPRMVHYLDQYGLRLSP